MQTIERVLQQLQQGKPILVADAHDRENEVDVVIAAQHISTEHINFLNQDAGGLICVALSDAHANQLQLSPMTQDNHNRHQTPFTVSVEAANGITTGISSSDRAITIKTLANLETKPSDLVSPGHIFPLRAHAQGILGRQGHTEASIELMQLATLNPAAVICELLNKQGQPMNQIEAKQFAEHHQLEITTTAEIRQFVLQQRNVMTKLSQCKLPINNTVFDCSIYQDQTNQQQHTVLSKPFIGKQPLVRIHSQCFTGDVLGSQRCDCGEQLSASINLIEQQGGLIIYLTQEGRGIGLAHKLQAYHLQDQGLDTVEANHKLGFQADYRDYYPAAHILKQLGIDQITLLTNNPEKIQQLQQLGIDVKRQSIQIKGNKHNNKYLNTKRNKMHHLLNEDNHEHH